jgi:hypothetical protein
METTQGISLYYYLYFKLVRMPCFSYYLLYFFFYKIGEQEGREQVLAKRGRGEVKEEGDGSNNVYTCK